MHTQKRIAERTHDAILDSALEVFCRFGYDGTTTRAIAYKAKVNEVTLFRHFGSKKKLFQAIVDRDMDISQVAAEIPPPHGEDPVEDLVRIGTYLSQNMQARARVSNLLITEGQRTGTKNVLQRLPTQGLVHLTPIFEKMGAKDPYIASVAFMSFLIRSVMFKQFLGEDPVVDLDEETIRRFSMMIAKGMR